MRDKKDSLSVVETVQPSAHFDLPAFWSVLSHLTWFQKLLMLVSDSSPACISFYPSLSSHYILNYSFNTYFSLPLWLLLQPGELTVTGATTTRPGESAESTRGTATEREATTAEREARVTTTPASEPKKTIIPSPPFLLCCQLQFACLPVVPISPNSSSQ